MEFALAPSCFGNENPETPFAYRTAEPEGEESGSQRPRILVVDDEKLLADTTAAILRTAGFETATAYEGFAALENAASFHPDYLLTDIMMPGMNGVELAIAMTQIHSAIKVLLFSGQAGISDILEQSRAKGYEFPLLAKPVHPTKLVQELKGLKRG